jgi:ribosomal protein S12 methylthiotransferase accessory factor
MYSIASGRPKVDGLPRITSAADTFARVKSTAQALGVTRLANITGLDRIGIPTYSAIVPRSDDSISVYTGKGLRPIDAKVGALMEAIERQVILRTRLPIVEGSYRQLRLSCSIVNPGSLNECLRADYSETNTYSWVSGTDLVSGEQVLVPAKLAGYIWADIPHQSCFAVSTTNGVASGNCREEAICHALCELIERDSWSLAELGAHFLPCARRAFASGSFCEGGFDDFEMFPVLELNDEPLLDLFHRAGLYPVLHDITSDLSIPTVFAAVPDNCLPGFPMVHCGLGTHPDARVAARRALTEAAQSRCVDIQGIREDIVPPDSAATAFNVHTRRVSAIDPHAWFLGKSTNVRSREELPSAIHDDICLDIEHIVSRLVCCSLDQVVVVDFSTSDDIFAVVRVIVPGLESWAIGRGRVGRRALEFWRTHA